MTSNKNFSGQSTPSIIDDTYYRCNFSQPEPVPLRDGSYVGVRLFPVDDTARTFIECNLLNCLVPPNSSVKNCNTALVTFREVDRTEDVEVDGRTVTRTTRTKDVFRGRYSEDGVLERP